MSNQILLTNNSVARKLSGVESGVHWKNSYIVNIVIVLGFTDRKITFTRGMCGGKVNRGELQDTEEAVNYLE